MSAPSKALLVSRRSFIAAAGIALGAAALPLKPAFASSESPAPVELDQTVSTDDYEFTFTSCEWSDAVYPPDTSSAYNYFPGESGKHYFIIHGRVKNLAGNACHLGSRSTVSFQFNDKYNYDGLVYTAVDNSTVVNNEYAAIDPLETVNLYVCVLVPDEIMNAFDNVQVDWVFYDLESEYLLQSSETPLQTYRFVYSQAAAGENTEENETDEIPLDALVLNGIKISLAKDFYAFQLEGQAGWAWTADGLGSICLSSREGQEIPSSDAKLDEFFANRVSSYADSQGWAVTRSERIDLADDLEGFLNVVDHRDGSITSFINIITGDSTFLQIDIVESASPEPSADENPVLLSLVVHSLGKQEEAAAASPFQEMEAKQIAGISLNYPSSCQDQPMVFDQHYLFDHNITWQTYVESYGGPQGEVSTGYDDASIWSNLFTYTGTYDFSAPEWPADYAQQFASAHNGWILSSGVLEAGAVTASAFTIRAEIETGTVVYVIAVIPQESGHPTVITMCCPVNDARRWNTAINAVLDSIEITGTVNKWTWQLSTQPGWHILVPHSFKLYEQQIEIYQYIKAWATDSDKLAILAINQVKDVATPGYYYAFGAAGDSYAKFMNMTNQWDANIPSGSVRFTEVHDYSDPDITTLVVDTHSGTDDSYSLSYLFLSPKHREFIMPTINAITSSITFE